MRIGINRCIFCSREDLTAEHLFPKWTRRLVRERYKKSQHTLRDFGRPSKGPLTKKIHPGDLKLTIVCARCNNGWMSKVQNSVKGLLRPLIQGSQAHSLTAEDTHNIALWATMSAIILEYTNPKLVTTSLALREGFYISPSVPQHWRVWIGVSNYHEAPSFFVSAAGIYAETAIPSPEDFKANVFTASWVIGSLFVHVYGHDPELIQDPVCNYNIESMLEVPIISNVSAATVPNITTELFTEISLQMEKHLRNRMDWFIQ